MIIEKKLKKYKNDDRVGEYHIYLDELLLYKEDIYIKKVGKKNKKNTNHLRGII